MLPGVSHIDISTKVWLVVAADFKLHYTTNISKLWQSVFIELTELLVNLTVFILEHNV